jgi:carbamate kinase
VDRDDPAFHRPTKPIGPFYTEAEAKRFARERGWSVSEDSGRGWRRVVSSPKPKGIVELKGIQDLIRAGHLVVAAGGGGVPVTVDHSGQEIGVEAVIDKDRASAFLASALGFDTFVIVTGVSHVAIGFGTPEQKNLDRLTVGEAARYMADGEFGEGSMRPKIESALAFLERGGKDVLITSPEELGPALAGRSGTHVIPD